MDKLKAIAYAEQLIQVSLAHLPVTVHEHAGQGESSKANPERPVESVDRGAHHDERHAEK